MLKMTQVTPNLQISVQCQFIKIRTLIPSYKMPATYMLSPKSKELIFIKATTFIS